MQSIFNAETDGLIYQRKGRGNLAKLQQQSPNRKNIWQIQKINYTSSFTNAAVVDFCTFGDGFYTSDGTWDFWGADSMGLNDDLAMEQLLCYDPFAGMFGSMGGGETCEQCRSRNTSACRSDKTSCVAKVVGLGVGIVGGCLWTGPGELICGVISIALGIAGGIECSSSYDSCIFRVDNNCPSCNQ